MTQGQKMIEIGQDFPDLTLPLGGGGQMRLADIRPRRLVLFTYGADGTPTCTAEVMEFNELAAAFAAKDCALLGLSKDSVKKHEKFAAKMGITLPLASDPGEVMDSIGAYGPKIFFGKPVVGVLRTTYLIDGQGKLAALWKVDRVKDHAAQVLAAL
jgi:thioredoxin-dependent peroxiredoxin